LNLFPPFSLLHGGLDGSKVCDCPHERGIAPAPPVQFPGDIKPHFQIVDRCFFPEHHRFPAISPEARGELTHVGQIERLMAAANAFVQPLDAMEVIAFLVKRAAKGSGQGSGQGRAGRLADRSALGLGRLRP
jgi:hypothetical protein